MTNIESFNVVRDAGLKNSNFLHVVWTGLRQSVPLKLRVYEPNFENILDLEKFKCLNKPFRDLRSEAHIYENLYKSRRDGS